MQQEEEKECELAFKNDTERNFLDGIMMKMLMDEFLTEYAKEE